MNHYRYLTLIVFAHIGGAQTRRQGEVQLYCTALPCAIEAVIQGKFNFRTVEGAFTQLIFKWDIVFFQRNGQVRLSTIPHFVATDTFFGTSGEFDNDFLEAKCAVHIVDHTDAGVNFIADLLFSTEDMRIILGEAAYTHQTMQRT